jgi:hypothetical protein
MYMGSHNNVSQLRVFEWADTSTSISWKDVNVRPWMAGAYSAPGPGGVNWLGRLDPRITAIRPATLTTIRATYEKCSPRCRPQSKRLTAR